MLYIFLILTIFKITKSEGKLICDLDYCAKLTFEERQLLDKPIYKTYSGHEIDWMDENDGWTLKRRLQYLEEQRITKQSRHTDTNPKFLFINSSRIKFTF